MNKTISSINRHTTYILPLILLVIDYFLIVGGVTSAYWLRKDWIIPVMGNFQVRNIYLFVITPVLYILILFLCNAYRDSVKSFV